MEYFIDSYLLFLRISLNYIKRIQALRAKEDSVELKYELNYHIFNFSQLFYASKERLNNYLPQHKALIDSFFDWKSLHLAAAGIVMTLANEWKHKGLETSQRFEVKLEEPDGRCTLAVHTILPQNHQFAQKQSTSQSLIPLFEDALSQLESFCRKNSFLPIPSVI